MPAAFTTFSMVYSLERSELIAQMNTSDYFLWRASCRGSIFLKGHFFVMACLISLGGNESFSFVASEKFKAPTWLIGSRRVILFGRESVCGGVCACALVEWKMHESDLFSLGEIYFWWKEKNEGCKAINGDNQSSSGFVVIQNVSVKTNLTAGVNPQMISNSSWRAHKQNPSHVRSRV